jgi:subtilase family serine protease
VLDDLNVFSQFYGLPQCTAANPCLQQIDLSNGAPVAPTADWGPEVAMDTQMVHAMAPGATIVLVTANSQSTTDLLSAVNYAAALPGVVAVSLSFSIYGEPAATYQAQDQLLAGFEANQGTIFFAASGDSGNSWQGAGYPAESPYVTAVGGTRVLAVAAGATGATETAWQYSSGGPSSYAPMPAWQTAYLGSALQAANAGMRATPDVAAVADYQHSAVAVYYRQQWIMAGGTSVSTPLWAGMSALLAQSLAARGSTLPALVRATAGGFNALIYQARLTQGAQGALAGLNDITSGSNNLTLNACSLCQAGAGYDDVTGLGVPYLGALLSDF